MVFRPLPLPFLLSILILPTKFRSLIRLVLFHLLQPLILLQFVNLLPLVSPLYHIMTQYIVSIFLSLHLLHLLFFLHYLQYSHSYSSPFYSMSTLQLLHTPSPTLLLNQVLLTHHTLYCTTFPLPYPLLNVTKCFRI